MDAGQRRFLEQRYRVSEWHGRSASRRLLKQVGLERSQLRGWRLQRAVGDERAKPPVIRLLWSRGESMDELLAVDFFECASITAAHDQLLEALSNMESGAVERRTDADAPGDVAFGLDDTMMLFARANMVVLIRNAGPTVVTVGPAARELDAMLVRRLAPARRR